MTQAGHIHVATTLLPRLTEFQELPPHVRAAIDDARKAGALLDENSDGSDVLAEIEHRAKVMAALRTPPEEPDLTEPGWPALAQMIEETSFLQVYRRAFFVRQQIGVPVDDELEAYAPVVETHRLAPFLEMFRTTIDEDKVAKALEGFNHQENTFVLARLWGTWSANSMQRAFTGAMLHRECLPNEAGLIDRMFGPRVEDYSAGPMLAVSPHSPYAMLLALNGTSRVKSADEKTWEQAAQRSPQLASEFATTWKDRGDLTKAEQFLKLAARLDPSHATYRKLAEHYQAQGDDENWLKAMNDLLETPSLGLEHARARCEIAEYYVNQREWEKALPYADAAAQTGAQWALNWGRAVNEANQNWQAAELAHVALIERYGENPVYWYFFCQRNGCGQLDTAREAAFPDGVSQLILKSDLTTNFVALALSMEGESVKALEILEREAKEKRTSWITMRAALMADTVGNAAKRDALLKQVVEQPEQPADDYDHRPHRAELVDLARALIADLTAGGKCDLDFDKLQSSRDRAPEDDRCSFSYYLGCYLDQRGKPDLAIKYWKESMAAQNLVMSARTAAGFELNRHGVKPSEWKELFLAKPKEMK